jgi:glucose-6-phosphate 1-dehydrogenase
MLDRQYRKSEPESAARTETAVQVPPCAMIIFGATGDLTKRLLVPALYNLVTAKRLADGFRLVGVGRVAETVEEWRDSLATMINELIADDGEFQENRLDQTAWRWLTDRMSYVQGDLNDGETYRRLREHLTRLDKTAGTAGNYLFYLAVADHLFGVTIAQLGAADLVTERDGYWRRVVIEKPFGHDLLSAKALNAEILKTLREHQIYRIDHFLGKETVQNIMALRFANGLFEPLWNRQHVDHVRGGNRRGRTSRQVLRGDRCAARHGAEPCIPAAGNDGHGAADLF